MKVLALSNVFPHSRDPGYAPYNRQQFEHLGRLCELDVLGAVDFRQYRRQRVIGAPTFQHLKPQWFTFWHLPRVGRRWQPQCWLASLEARHGRWIRSQGFDCLLVAWAYPDAVAVSALANRLCLPLVVKVHGSDINGLPDSGNRRDRVAAALGRAAAVVTVSQALADRVAALGIAERKIHVLYNGVDQHRFSPGSRARARTALGLDESAKLILFVGNLKASKGCLDLLDALPGVLAREPRIRLVMLGNGPDRRAIERHRHALDLDEVVKMPGAVAHAKLPDWFRAADLLCLPSHAEGVPNVVLEAMASGLPVVASRVGGIPEVVPDFAGMLVPAQDRGALAGALHRALAEEWDARRIAEHSRHFDWADNARKLYDIVQSAVPSAAVDPVHARHGRT